MTNFKRFLTLFLIATLTAFSVQVWGAVASFAPSDFSGQGTSGTGSAISAIVDGVTFSCNKGYGTTQIRCYSGGKITISSSNTITAISFTFSGSYTGGLNNSYTGLSTTSWNQNLSSQARITAVSVTYTPAASCDKKVTVSKGAESHGTFSLDKTGEQETCSGLTVTVTDIDPDDGYQFDHIEQSGVATGVTINDAAKTVTYANNTTGSSSISVVFEAIPTYTVTLDKNGSTSDITGCSGTYTLPTTGAHVAEACEGWSWHCWANAPYSTGTPTATAPSSTVITSMSSAGTAYAVYKHEEAGGGPSNVTFNVGTDQGSRTSQGSDAVTKTGITISSTSAALGRDDEYRIYSGSTTTISTSTGKITSIVLNSTASGTSEYGPGKLSGTGYSYSGSVGTWIGNATSVTLSASAQFRATSIVVTTSGGGTTTYTSSPDCTPCLTKVTLTKGEESHGTFTLDKSNGEYNNCTSNFVVTVSGITPASGYYCTGVTATGDHNSVSGPDGSGNYTVTYEKENAITSIITANFAPNPKYTVIWSMNGDESSTDSYEEGEAIVFPASATGCDGKVFRGWSAVPVPETDVEPSYVTAAVMGTSPITYYAVYAEASGGGGSAQYTLVSSTSGDLSGTYLLSDGTHTATGYSSNTLASTDITPGTTRYADYEFTLAKGSGDYSSYYSITDHSGNAITGKASGTDLSTGGTGYLMYWEVSTTSIANASTGRHIGYNSTNDYYKAYASSNIATNPPALLYKWSVNTTYSGYTTSCGASISAQNIGWMTAANGQKVKVEVPVTAKNFDDPATLSVTSDNSHFAVSLAATAVPAGTTGLATTLTVEYTPAEASVKETDVHITLTAGDKVRVITVNGRSLPEEFLIIAKQYDKWYALPADMNSGADKYNGVIVEPNNPTTPTVVPSSPGNVVYSAYSVADGRYADAGSCLRLQGNGGRCLWANGATNGTTIKNDAMLGSANDSHYEWALITEDGSTYTIINPAHPDAAANRQLALGGSGGTQYGLYKTATTFYIVPAGCTSMPQDVRVSAHRIDATFAWNGNVPSMTIDVYTNEEMTAGHLSATATSAPYIFSGLAESTHYWFKLTPGSNSDCAVNGDFTTTGPTIDITEWKEDAVVLHIDKGDINPVIVIDGQEEHGSISGGGGSATELFFAKYFEGSGDMKLLSIFNGTGHAIDLKEEKYTIYMKCVGNNSNTWSSAADKEYDLKTLGTIKAGQEIIFFTPPLSTQTPAECSNAFLTAKEKLDGADENPRWIKCGTGSKYGFVKMEFSGNDPLLLMKNGTIIDVFGAKDAPPASTSKDCRKADIGWQGSVKNMDYGKSVDAEEFNYLYEASSKPHTTAEQKKAILEGFNINLDDENIAICSARCILFRNKTVTSGENAVSGNTTTFATFTPDEWNGRSVCMTNDMLADAGVADDGKATCNSYQALGAFDFNEYYIDYTSHIEPGQTLDQFTSDPETKEYTIPIANLNKYTCLNIRFQLKKDDEVLTEAAQQVPIIITGNMDTNDPIFSELVKDKVVEDDPSTWIPLYPESKERCSTCDVVVLGTATLTKGSDSDGKDVPEVGNVKVYPGGKLIVPTGTNYTVNSLAFRRQEDAVSTANIEGNLTIGTDDAVYLDMRIDPTNWHYFTLPYDCKVEDIRFANPNETAVPTLGTDFLLKWYNGDKRAATQSTGCWEMVSPSATLKKGIGYIFALPGEGKERQEFRFPMSNDVVTEEKATYKDAMGIYAYGGDKSMTEVRANHRGWNLIGNPYLLPYTSDITSPVMTGLIVEDHSEDDPQWNGHYKFDPAPATNLRYIVEPIANGWAGYEQVALSDYSMKPFTAYFVQVDGADPSDPQGVRFNLSRVNRSSIVARQAAEYEEDTHPVWCAVDLTNSKGEKDETTLLISDDFTDEYDMMDDLVKMRGTYYQYAQITTKPVLASRNNEGEMAFNALPDLSAKAGVPLHYFTAYGGEYTISYNNKYDRNNEVTEVKLLDTKTNEWYDLMAQAYTFTTNREDNKNRFYLSVGVERYNAPQVTTGCMQVRGGDTGGPRKILIDGHVYIQRGGAIYDITGKQMLNK